MTDLESAIKEYKELADEYNWQYGEGDKARKYQQLFEWLSELQDYRRVWPTLSSFNVTQVEGQPDSGVEQLIQELQYRVKHQAASCQYCKYEGYAVNTFPCSSCRCNFPNRFQCKEDTT